MKIIILFLVFSCSTFAESPLDEAKDKTDSGEVLEVCGEKKNREMYSADQTESTTSGFQNAAKTKIEMDDGISILLESKDPVYVHKGTGRGLSIVDGKIYRCFDGPPETVLTKGVFYLGDQAISLDVSGIGDPWMKGYKRVQYNNCYIKKLNQLPGEQAIYILRIAFFRARADDFYVEWHIYNGRSLRTAMVDVGDAYPEWFWELQSPTLDITGSKMTCGEMIQLCQKKAEKVPSLNFVKGEEQMKMLFYWWDWHDIYNNLFSGEEETSNEKYIGFNAFMKNGEIVMKYGQYDQKSMNELLKKLKDISPEKKICFIVQWDESYRNKPFSEIWELLYPLHKLSEGRLIMDFKKNDEKK